jgi:RNA polymerase sigma-70 factor (ECF subfamily)
LISTARFQAIDTLRRRARFDASQDELVRYLEAQSSSPEEFNAEDSVEDDRLRLIFTCCHPSLTPEARVALTLWRIQPAPIYAAGWAGPLRLECLMRRRWR